MNVFNFLAALFFICVAEGFAMMGWWDRPGFYLLAVLFIANGICAAIRGLSDRDEDDEEPR